jgi:hypothetical protein
VAFNGSTLVLILTALLNTQNLSLLSQYWSLILYLISFILCSVLELTIALLSFVPHITPLWIKAKGEPERGMIFFFYGDIAKYDKNNGMMLYLQKLSQSISSEEEKEVTQMEKFYAHQIIVNSQIAVRKYNFFNAAL